MKLKLYACLAVVGALVAVAPAVAAPRVPTFLSVDIDGANIGGAQMPGTTEPGFQGWPMFQGFDPFDPNYDPNEDVANLGAGLTMVFPTSEGMITATLSGEAPNSGFGARNRNEVDPAGTLNSVYDDFPFANRGVDGFGQHYFKLELSGLVANQEYEFTGLAREVFNSDPTSWQRWTDLDTLGGVDGPGAWLDANVGADELYQPAPGGVNNPIPSIARGPISGAAPPMENPYLYSRTFRTDADGSGKVTVYTWADPDSYSGTQTVTLLNGFQLGISPEPGSLALAFIGLAGLAGFRRRAR